MEQRIDNVIAIQNGEITKEPPSPDLMTQLSVSVPIAFTLVHGASQQELFTFADLQDVVEEEIHLRKLLHIHNRNRRKLEEQEATFGSGMVPVHIATALQEELIHIDRITTRIKYVVFLIEELRSKQKSS